MTPLDRFRLGGRNPENGVWVREWYCIGSIFMPNRVKYEGKELFGFRQLIAVDVACNFILGNEPLPKEPGVLELSDLIPFLDRITRDHGEPSKGYILSHSSWLSSTELAVDEDTAEQGEFLEKHGIAFGPMPDSDKDQLREWASELQKHFIFDADQIPIYA